MRDLLFLAHRIPYPPNKGDKIRSFNVLRWLARRYRVHLGAFVDDPADWPEAPRLDEWCASRCLLPLGRTGGLARGLASLVGGGSLSTGYYRSSALARWVDATVRTHRIERAFVYSSSVAPYAAGLANASRVVDFCDLDSEKFRQYGESGARPQRWLYALEGRRLAADERRFAAAYDACVFVSDAEAALFRPAPGTRVNVAVMRNGVDCEHFDPAARGARPFGEGSCPVVFTGAMDYRPNVEAVAWFAREVLPAVRRVDPRVEFWIVGSNPAREVQQLAALAGVSVTGRVPDTRPYLGHASCVIAPLRVARGVQNKVLEAFAMGCAVVATPAAFEGIDPPVGEYAFRAEGAADFAARVLERVAAPLPDAAAAAARRFARDGFGWDANLAVLEGLLER